jgi:hypothetical protein
MSPIKEKTLALITRLPDEKVIYFYNILQNIEALSNNGEIQLPNDSKAAFNRLLKFKGTLPADFDYENELESMRLEKYAKYANIG